MWVLGPVVPERVGVGRAGAVGWGGLWMQQAVGQHHVGAMSVLTPGYRLLANLCGCWSLPSLSPRLATPACRNNLPAYRNALAYTLLSEGIPVM